MNERYATALELRRQGKSYREIGEALGVSFGRARMLVLNAVERERELEATSDLSGLDRRTLGALLSCGIQSRRAVRNAIENGALMLTPGIGAKSLAVIHGWLGVARRGAP